MALQAATKRPHEVLVLYTLMSDFVKILATDSCNRGILISVLSVVRPALDRSQVFQKRCGWQGRGYVNGLAGRCQKNLEPLSL